jgi:hypothetical protein
MRLNTASTGTYKCTPVVQLKYASSTPVSTDSGGACIYTPVVSLRGIFKNAEIMPLEAPTNIRLWYRLGRRLQK